MKFTKILVNYVIKYFTGFLIIFMSSILVATIANSTIKNNIIDRSEMNNTEGIKNIEVAIAKMDLINQIMSQNSTFTTIVYQRGPIQKHDILKLREANQMYNEISFIIDYTPYVFTLFKNNDLYLSASQCSTSFENYTDKFLSIEINGEVLSSLEIKTLFFDKYMSHETIIKVDKITYINNEKVHTLNNALIYLTSSSNSSINPMYISCFIIDSEFIIDKIMMRELKEKGFLYIENIKTKEVFIQYGNVPAEVSDSKNGQLFGGDDKYRVIVNNQKDLNWKIVTGVPMSIIKDQMKPVTSVLIIYLCIGMFLVIILTFYFSLKRYSGVKKVLFAIPFSKEEETDKLRFDEYRILTENILQLKNNGNNYRIKMEELLNKNKENLLKELIIMGIHTDEERKNFETCFDKEPEFFCVALVRLFQKEIRTFEEITLLLAEYMKKEFKGRFTNVYGGINDEIFLFELDPNQEANVSNIKTLFEKISIMLAQKYDVTFHIGISAIGTDIYNMNKCYEQARQIVQAQYAYCNQNIIKSYDININALYQNPVNLEFLNRMYTLLLCGHQKEIIEELDRVEAYYNRMAYLYELQKEQFFYSVRNVIYTVCLHLNIESDNSEVFPYFNNHLQCCDMIGMIKDSVCWLCDYINQSKKSKNESLKKKIIDYLHENYHDNTLSAYLVSKEIGISEKYLSQFIKEQTGETFSAYLLQIRIEKAKEYLETTDYSNDKISELIGFSAVNTFYRNFNKQTGVTPKIYKEYYAQDKLKV